ncbi:MAG: hypothetical protein QOD99_154 [Chthoniobacter sp.]|jgi:hypothetical protein|nr:hypothetical protein [Chthoniobacter sp.]
MHLLNIICGVIGVAGLLMIGIGRWMLISEVAGMGTFWKIAARMPMSEVLILSRFWETAKNGAFTSLAGLVLLIPWGALQLSATKAEAQGSRAARLDNDSKASLYASMKLNHDSVIEAKQAKFKKLTDYMAAWYSSLESRRALVKTAAPEQLVKFNEEVAAYVALRGVTKDELAELTALQTKKYEFRDLKTEDFDAWLKHRDDEAKLANRSANEKEAAFTGE